jgi:hypothetical protein
MSGVPLWILVAVALGPLAVLVVLRRLASPPALALADAAALAPAARRTLAVRGALAVVLATLVAGAAATLREPEDPVGELLPGGAATVVVLDVSASVSDLVYHEIAETLGLLASAPDRSARVGLVLFSDSAYEALPPSAPASELRSFVRFFQPRTSPDERTVTVAGIGSLGSTRQFGPTVSQGSLNYIMSPWFRKFSGGTSISTGLAAARAALADTGARGRVLLVSDLDDTFSDEGALAQELATYARERIPLEVVALPPATAATVKLFRNVLGDATTVRTSSSLRSGAASAAARAPALPVAFMVLAGLVALALALHEARFAPLRWEAAR